MSSTGTELSAKSKRTLLLSLLMSAPGPILTGIAAVSSRSATQIADFIRRSMELVALFIAWWVFHKRERDAAADETYRARLERASNLSVTLSMACSGIVMLLIGVYRLFSYQVSGSVTLGLVIAVLGLIANTAFWWRYRSFQRQAFDPVIAGQQKLYRAKALVDLCVVAALATVAVAPAHPVTRYVDALGSIVVAGYLLYQAFDSTQKARQAQTA